MFQVPYAAALAALGQPDDLPQDEGPFSLHHPDLIARLLEDAGWRDVVPVVHRLRLPYAGGVDGAAAAEASLDFGPTRIITKDLDDADRGRVRAAITEALQPHEVDGTVLLDGTVLVTTARRG